MKTQYRVAPALRLAGPLSPRLDWQVGSLHSIVVGVWMLQEGEDVIVAKRLHEALMSAVNT
jgi:hypothetical protein